MTKHVVRFAVCAVSAAFILAAPLGSAQVVIPAKAGGGRGLTGAGSSFVYPLMSKWTATYHEQHKVKVNYQSMGSGAGIKQFTAKTIDFGGTDAPMTAEELKAAGDGVLHIPVVMGAVAVTYNLEGVEKPLVFTGPMLAGVFMGRIKKWNDAAIAAENAGVKLPDADIVVVHRSDGSGTTFIFSDYLAKVSGEWKEKVGTGKSLNWPVGLGGKGNEGVAAQVKGTANSIGYVEVIYATQNKMAVASLRNRDGQVAAPTLEAVTAAAGSLADIPDDLCMSITDAPGKASYPISGIVWLLARSGMDNPAKGKMLNEFVAFVLSDEAQEMATPLHYSKLPANLLELCRKKAAQIK